MHGLFHMLQIHHTPSHFNANSAAIYLRLPYKNPNGVRSNGLGNRVHRVSQIKSSSAFHKLALKLNIAHNLKHISAYLYRFISLSRNNFYNLHSLTDLLVCTVVFGKQVL